MDSELKAALTSAKAALDLVLGAVRARDEAKLQASTLDLRERMYAISTVAMGYIERNAELVAANARLVIAQAEQDRRHAELEDQLREREKYTPCELAPGVVAYRYDAPVEGTKGRSVYCCQPCYDAGVKTLLRPVQSTTYGPIWHCVAEQAHDFSQDLGNPPLG